MRDRRSPDRAALRVNPIRCEGVGICAHLAPDLVTLDPWGFPILLDGALEDSEVPQAQRAVAGCPRRALMLDEPKR